jgi:hypothetical protein
MNSNVGERTVVSLPVEVWATVAEFVDSRGQLLLRLVSKGHHHAVAEALERFLTHRDQLQSGEFPRVDKNWYVPGAWEVGADKIGFRLTLNSFPLMSCGVAEAIVGFQCSQLKAEEMRILVKYCGPYIQYLCLTKSVFQSDEEYVELSKGTPNVNFFSCQGEGFGTPEQVLLMLPHWTEITRLIFGSSRTPHDRLVEYLVTAPITESLTALRFEKLKMEKANVLPPLIPRLKEIKSLDLSDSSSSSKVDNMTAEVLGLIGKHCQELEALDIGDSKQLDEFALEGFLRNSPSKKLVSFRAIRNPLTTAICTKLAEYFPELQEFVVSRSLWKEALLVALCDRPLFDLALGHVSIAESTLTSALCSLPTLTSLDIQSVDEFNDSCLEVVANTCAKLLKATFIGCPGISDYGVRLVAKNCPLKVLHVSKCTDYQVADPTLFALAEHRHGLKTLGAARVIGFTVAGFSALSQRCHELAWLNLSESKNVTDDAIQTLSIGLGRSLRCLFIDFCPCTDLALEYLGKNCCVLQTLSVRGVEGISDHGLPKLRCSTLKSLTISDTPIGSAGVIGFVRGKVHDALSTLYAKNLLGLTDQAVEQLLDGCPRLAQLSLCSCEGLSAAILPFCGSHQGLEYLNVDCILGITLENLRALKAQKPSVSTFPRVGED